MSSTAPFAVTVDDGVATVAIGDGRRHNALDTASWRRLGDAVAGLPDDLQVTVIRGAAGTFCGGSDLREWDGAPPATVDASFSAMEDALQVIEAVAAPTLAVVEGAATGAGCLLALACDVQLVARSAVIGMPIARLGILLSPAFATRLTVRVGPTRAKEMLYTGRILGADEAERVGLVSEVVDDAALELELTEMLQRWRAQPATALRAAKRAVNLGLAPLTVAAQAFPAGPASDRDVMTTRVRDFLAGGRTRQAPRRS